MGSFSPRIVSAVALTTVVVGLAAGMARAGGVPVEVLATTGRLWVTSDGGLVEIDTGSGRVLRTLRVHDPFPLEIGSSRGSVWVATVEGGFGAGAVTRVPLDRGRSPTSPIVLPHRGVLDLAVGPGTTWALAGPWSDLRLVASDQATARNRSVPVRHDLGWIATDATGSTPGLYGIAGLDLVRVLPGGRTSRLHGIGSQPAGPPLVGLGSVWVADRGGLTRLSATTGDEQGRIALPMAGARLAIGGGAVWLVRLRPAVTHGLADLVRIDPTTMRETGRVRLPGSIGGIAFGDGALWLGRTDTRTVLRVNPTTLRARPFAHLD